MLPKIKKALTLIIIFSTLLTSAQDSSPDKISTYENLRQSGDIFVDRLIEGGASDEEVREFMDSIDIYVNDNIKTVNANEMDFIFIKDVLPKVMTQFLTDEKLTILIAFDMAFREEIEYMNEKVLVPESLRNLMYTVFGNKIIVIPSIPLPGRNELEESAPPEPSPPPTEEPLPFDDIADFEWCIESVVKLKEAGIIHGSPNGLFDPEKDVSREEFIKMIITALLDVNDMYTREFSQGIDTNAWYRDYVAAAKYYSLYIGMFEDYGFEPEKPINRQDMATLAYRASKRAEISLPKLRYSTDFLDVRNISFYAIEPIRELQEADIIKGVGDNKFSPHDTLNRASAALIVHNLYKLTKNGIN